MFGITSYQDYLGFWENIKDKVPIYIAYSEVRCKFCNSKNIIKYGRFKNMQRWWCKDCQRKFADNQALPGMRTPTTQIAAAIHMYYEGLSLGAIRRKLEQDYNSCPSDSTIYEWVNRFTVLAVNEARDCHPQVGDRWVLHNSSIKIGGKKYWLIDVFDTSTRFLLASRLSGNRNLEDVKQLMEAAREKARKIPQKLIINVIHEWAGYLSGIEMAYGADSKQIEMILSRNAAMAKELERWRVILKERNSIIQSLKDKDTAELILSGWVVHYNYFRPHEMLSGKTPAKKAGISYNIGLSRKLPVIHGVK